MQSNDTAIARPESVAPSDFARWLAKVEIPANPDDCFIWKAGIATNGYGKFWINGRTLGAHVVAYAWFTGSNPDGLFVCHSCDGGGRRDCVNPRHLYLDTHQGNILFAAQHGRMATGERNGHSTKPERTPRGSDHPFHIRPELCSRGERHGMAKLNEQAIREIRALGDAGDLTHRQIAALYGVGKTVVTRAIARQSWRHVP
jgi:hypothetical protein